MRLDISTLLGEDLRTALPQLAALRIEVFRDYPYLYDGSIAYEERYVAALLDAKDSVIVLARDGSRIVGCATGSAIEGHHKEFAAPFAAHGFNTEDVFYCGESVLLPSYRGRGIGHAFFDFRETHAKARGYKYSAFCGVVRPLHHALKPATYSPLDAFWKKRGYGKVEGMITAFSWKDVDQPRETNHPMQFWIREL